VLEIGLDRATTSAVAERLGVDQSTLYRHIASREDMLDSAVGVAAARTAWPEPGDDWAQYLRDCAHAMWTMFSSTPGLAERLRGMASPPELLAAHVYDAVAYLHRRLEIPVREAALIVDTVGDLTTDSYLTVASLDRPTDGERTFRDLAIAAMEAADPAAYGGAVASEYVVVFRDALGGPGAPSTWWMDKVELVIDGVRHRIARRDH